MIAHRHKLEITLPSDREIRLQRVFDFPKKLIYQALIKPEHVRQWWGCAIMTMSVCEMDFRVGGAWRFVLSDPSGAEHPFKGVYKEIVPEEKIVATFIYDVDFIRDHPALETLTLVERDGQTTLTSTVLHDSRESRDGHLQSGMEPGAAETYDRLEDLLARQ